MKYAIAGLVAFGALFSASVQAAPTSPANVATQAASSDAVQKVQFYAYGGPYYGAPGWGYRRWGYRPWGYRYGYYRPWGPGPWAGPGPWFW